MSDDNADGAKMSECDWRAIVEDMCHQFAYESQKRGRFALTTGGLGALEDAFEALGWDDPHPVPEAECEIKGCHKRATCGTPWKDKRAPTGYVSVCGDHYRWIQDGATMSP